LPSTPVSSTAITVAGEPVVTFQAPAASTRASGQFVEVEVGAPAA